MKNFSFSCFILIVLSGSFSSYSQHTLKGNLQDNNQNPVAFANVVLFKNDTVTVYRGVVSDEDGNYLFEDIA
ncbi:carboxypeptidase-like regulatory domain-containing protein [Antarcticibacterium sp. 1MA-6-2]|uniref:carboxypeptidase-like regulatory domain-containing protein n=1 Tax=Antarcticibacterium sp. 1MA-6-2 TaxID=2908210 RepID=UPI001F2D31AB|nr:carboxypeptidase-like regulatory domain-containing protein [Antarcticibacterium sp. 1MA-6-2]UJH90131.1 carboxypeptidase-like regulatory domain-containing protein [Antarcticibacterium sp. 1MA-6-2]